ncbi:hypothetical protein ACTD5D_20765 [Nocardia takedensis]|uniref:hypothetical protein n=1 Tax=Nocardia takedensis TaxID=259390 RepID=UPI0012F66221|nr:hypothetical protein [Nocardia takedensis]
MTVGATVAYITGGHRSETVHAATVDRIGRRDVVVTVDGRRQRFNIGNTTQRGEVRWLSRRVDSWSQDTYLASLDDPRVAAIRAVRTESDAARALHAAVDTYLEIVDEAK